MAAAPRRRLCPEIAGFFKPIFYFDKLCQLRNIDPILLREINRAIGVLPGCSFLKFRALARYVGRQGSGLVWTFEF
ncbi:MAG: hypothetical protein PVF55_03600 [Desulfobacterales bacterium]|jgi:hypothetical protein